MDRRIDFNGRKLLWRLDMRAFHEAETMYRRAVTVGDASYITVGRFPVFMWVGFLTHEIETGEPSPSFDEVLAWCNRPGPFKKYFDLVLDALNRIGGDEEEASELTDEQKAAPFLTGEKSNGSDTSS